MKISRLIDLLHMAQKNSGDIDVRLRLEVTDTDGPPIRDADASGVSIRDSAVGDPVVSIEGAE